MDQSDLIARLSRLGSSLVSDVLDEAGLHDRVLSSSLQPLDRHAKLAGAALCARNERLADGSPSANAVSGYAVERSMRAGMIAVVEAGGGAGGALVGGLAATSLASNGCRGLLINGAIRDSLEILELGLPTFCLSQTPQRSTGRRQFVDIDCPVDFPGCDGGTVTIHPGDFLLGDSDGIVVLPSIHAEELILAAEKAAEIEDRIQQAVNAGATREEALSKWPRFDHVRRLA